MPPLDLDALIESISQAGIEYIVVGGPAAVAQGAPVTTFEKTLRLMRGRKESDDV